MRPEITIIMESTLSAMALRSLLMDIVHGVEVGCYRSLEEYKAVEGVMTAHFFVSEAIAFRHAEFFREVMRRTIVITSGTASSFVQSGFRTIDATESEQHIARSIMSIHRSGHPVGHPMSNAAAMCPGEVRRDEAQLSSRERDVLALVVKGFINKEIADKLNISVATVIFHRNNISEKLNTRSIGRLTIYAVLNNIVSLSEI